MAGIRDEELKRLEKYAYGLGVSKITYEKPRGDATGAEWILNEDGTVELTFYMHYGLSKRSLILNFVHELAHHLAWIYRNKQEDSDTLKALNAEDGRRHRTDPLIPKEQRKLIYLTEKEDAKYREFIWKEVNINIPREYLLADIAVDVWGYKQYYLKGNFPTNKEVKNKLSDLFQKENFKRKDE